MQTDKLIAYTKFLTCQNLYSQLNELINIPKSQLDNMGIKLNFKLNSDYRAIIAFDIKNNINSTSELLSKIFLPKTKSNIEIFNSICSSLFKSYFTFIRVKSLREESFIGVDLILNLEREIFYNKDSFKPQSGEYLLSRIIDIDGYKFLLNSPTTFNINIGPTIEGAFKFFIENKYKNFHKNIRIIGMDALKNSSMDLLFSLYYLLESIDELDLIIQDDDYTITYDPILNLFEEEDKKYVLEVLENIEFEDNFILDDLNMIYNRFLRDRKLNFSLVDKFNFLDIFKYLSLNGDFKTIYNLTSCVILFIDIYNHLKEINSKFNKPILELKQIVDNILLYKNNLLNSTNGIYSDENILNLLYGENIKFENNELIRYFIQFVNFFFLSATKVSKNSKHLTTGTIKNLLNYLNLNYNRKSKSISLKSYPILNWFFNICLEKGFLIKINDTYYVTQKYQDFMYLEIEFKYNFMIYNIFSNIEHDKSLKEFTNTIKSILIEIKNNRFKLEDVKENGAFSVLLKAELINIFYEKITLTRLGEKIFNYYFKPKANITNISAYLK